MSYKTLKNSICPLCNSGLLYKECCGKSQPLKGTSYRFIYNKPNATIFDKQVFAVLQQYPDDYINPIKRIGEVFYVIVDESNIDGDYAVGGILLIKSEVEKNIKIKSDLMKLVEDYNIDHIHFTDIFGKRILGSRKKEFINKYIEIIKPLNMIPFTVNMTDREIKAYLKLDKDIVLTKNQRYMALTHKLMFNLLIYVIQDDDLDLIIELWREQESVTIEKRLLHQINIKGLIGDFPFKYISIYKDYIIFTKEDLLFSSLSDYIAYLTISLYPKIRRGISSKKLIRSHYELLRIYSEIFKVNIGMRSEEFNKMIESVKKTKLFIPR